MPKPPATRSQRQLANIPSVAADLYANVGRYAGAAVLTVFEQIGGTDKMAEWAEENPSDFYKSVFTKIISSPKTVEVSGRVTIEDAIKALDMEEGVDYYPAPSDAQDAEFTDAEEDTE
jgi:hypothetical protein